MEEIWKAIDNTDGRYEISNYGRVKSLSNCRRNFTKILKLGLDKNGYYVVGVKINGKQKSLKIHRLVSIAFIPNPFNLPEVNHKDGNKSNPFYLNLEWSYGSHNVVHAFQNGLRSCIGETCKWAKLTNLQVMEIFNYSGELNNVQIGKIYKVDSRTISDIRLGSRWSHLTGKTNPKRKGGTGKPPKPHPNMLL